MLVCCNDQPLSHILALVSWFRGQKIVHIPMCGARTFSPIDVEGGVDGYIDGMHQSA
jgi:hypothetical protein